MAPRESWIKQGIKSNRVAMKFDNVYRIYKSICMSVRFFQSRTHIWSIPIKDILYYSRLLRVWSGFIKDIVTHFYLLLFDTFKLLPCVAVSLE